MKVVDLGISITAHGTRWHLHVPIKTGHLQIEIEQDGSDLSKFLSTAFNSTPRRFGEDPISEKLWPEKP